MLREAVTTPGYVVGNVAHMPKRAPGWSKRPAERRRTFIAEWRDFRGLTQEALAELLDTTKATISRIEGRKIGYTQDFLEACADALGVHQSVLLSRAPSEAEKTAAISESRRKRA
jgi:ribosome-binding protein aMBF1 (putative translation factor)